METTWELNPDIFENNLFAYQIQTHSVKKIFNYILKVYKELNVKNPSEEEIAENCKCSTPEVRASLKMLNNMRLIKIIKEKPFNSYEIPDDLINADLTNLKKN